MKIHPILVHQGDVECVESIGIGDGCGGYSLCLDSDSTQRLPCGGGEHSACYLKIAYQISRSTVACLEDEGDGRSAKGCKDAAENSAMREEWRFHTSSFLFPELYVPKKVNINQFSEVLTPRASLRVPALWG